MENDGAAAIRGVNLTKKFRSGESELTIFAGLDFAVGCGERLALIGESGDDLPKFAT
jgi:predicted ABC-type transport system involved in lysophospholipase L1 biosynthesis ATPase subunit